jgi:hypothetical protein
VTTIAEIVSTRVFADADRASSVGFVSPTRYRCAACGNLTRFDVVSDRRTRAFHHFSVGGDLSVEDEEVLSQSVVEVSCRWCGHGRAVEVLDETSTAAADAGGPAA